MRESVFVHNQFSNRLERPGIVSKIAVVTGFFLVLLGPSLSGAEGIREALGIEERELKGRWKPAEDIQVTMESVERYLSLAPLFLALEREQFEILEESRRSHHQGKKRRLTHEMTEILRRAERRAGMTHADFRELRRRIRTVHRALYYQRAADDDYRKLLKQWDEEAESGRANHEFYSRAKETFKATKNRARQCAIIG